MRWLHNARPSSALCRSPRHHWDPDGEDRKCSEVQRFTVTWEVCANPEFGSGPRARVPAAVRRAGKMRKPLEGSSHQQCTPSHVVKHLAAARSTDPDIVVAMTHHTSLIDIKFTSDIASLALTAAALYSVLHGYRMVLYEGKGMCNSDIPPPQPQGWTQVIPRRHMKVCSKKPCCWQGQYWLRAEWMKPAALVDMAQRFPNARWTLLLDTDAVPRYSGWSVEDTIAWSLDKFVDDEGHRRTGVDQSRIVAIMAQELADPASVSKSNGEKPNPVYELGKRYNTGVLFIRGGERGLNFSKTWWAARDFDCDAQCDNPSTPSDYWTCQKRGMFRLWDEADQSALGQWVVPRVGADHFGVLPHLALSTGSGSVFGHMYNSRLKSVLCYEHWIKEHIARFGATAMQGVCWNITDTHECAKPELYEGRPGEVRKCVVDWAHKWLGAVLDTVEGIPLSWGNASRIDRRCYHTLQGLAQVSVPTPQRRIRLRRR
eukprot:Hpha_TRINITY_DN10367_c0_g1::TRINITY_DN10367_c0_g1_i1::g.116004::m.116004